MDKKLVRLIKILEKQKETYHIIILDNKLLK